jgi:hypothetical protein
MSKFEDKLTELSESYMQDMCNMLGYEIVESEEETCSDCEKDPCECEEIEESEEDCGCGKDPCECEEIDEVEGKEATTTRKGRSSTQELINNRRKVKTGKGKTSKEKSKKRTDRVKDQMSSKIDNAKKRAEKDPNKTVSIDTKNRKVKIVKKKKSATGK